MGKYSTILNLYPVLKDGFPKRDIDAGLQISLAMGNDNQPRLKECKVGAKAVCYFQHTHCTNYLHETLCFQLI
jgi:hypothetical protein